MTNDTRKPAAPSPAARAPQESPLRWGQVNPEPTERYNLVVLGGGPVGLSAAAGAATLGARVALVERATLGEDTWHAASVPALALVRAARAAAECRRAHSLGLRAQECPELDLPAMMKRVRAIHWRIASRNSVPRMLEIGVDVFTGEGSFTDRSHVQACGRTLAFTRALIATGARPIFPAIPGLAGIECLTSENLTQLVRLPQLLGIIGGDSWGCEMAQVFARLGSRVILFEQAAQCLPQEDPDVAALVQAALERDGVVLRLGCEVIGVEAAGKGCAMCSRSGGRETTETFDKLLVAAGRAPRVSGLNLEAADVRYDAQGIAVNAFLCTSNSRIFAAGDVCSQYRYTQAPDALAHVVIANALFFGTERASDLRVPRCVYTDPEVAHVGLHENEAKEARLHTLRLPLDELDRAVLDDVGPGLLKIHHDSRGMIRGATLVAPHAGDIIGEIVVAMNHGVRLGALAHDLHPYPTLSEGIKRAGDLYRRSLLTPAMSRFLRRLLEWRR